MTGSTDRIHLRVILVAFLISLVLYMVGMLFSHLRVWGVGQWAHFPWLAYLGALVAALLVVGVVVRSASKSVNAQEKDTEEAFSYLGMGMFAFLMAVFHMFRGRLHFLGDGYTLLANVALDNPIIKTRNLGEALIHGWVYSLLTGESTARALLTYQLVSYLGGAIFIVGVLLSAKRLFDKTMDRVLFSLGMFSGGYMLLFFGYAEHYSLFVPSVAIFGLIGLLVVRGKLSRWYIVPSVLLSIFLHVFGITLLPAALYLLSVDSSIAKRLKEQSNAVKIILAGAILAVIAVLFVFLYNTNYFFRFAFVPILPDRFTLDNYTLFSLRHIVDILNLSLLLLPGLLAVVAALFFIPIREVARQRDITFLLIFLLPTMAAAVVFDAKMGMARDWDLFSFFGIPLALIVYYFLIRSRASFKYAPTLAVVAITLGFFALIPRVVGQTVETVGLGQIYDYAKMDKKKSLFLFQQLHDYYWQHGQYERSPLLNFDFNRHFPEYNLTTEGASLRQRGSFAEAADLFKQAIEYNPTFAPAYSNLGSAYIEMGKHDSAMSVLTVALGLSPHRIETLYDLGRAYYHENDPEEAENCFRKARAINPDYMPAGLALLALYAESGEKEKHHRLLLELAASDRAPAGVHRQLGEYYQSVGDTGKASEQFEKAAAKSTDTGEAETSLTEGDRP